MITLINISILGKSSHKILSIYLLQNGFLEDQVISIFFLTKLIFLIFFYIIWIHIFFPPYAFLGLKSSLPSIQI